MKNRKIAGILMVMISAVLYGLNSVLVKLTTQLGAGVGSVMLIRGCWVVLMTGLMLFQKKETVLLPRLLLLEVTVFGIAGGVVTELALTSAYLLLPVGTVTIIHYLYPVLVNVGGFLLCKKPPQKSTTVVLFIAMLGIIAFFEPGSGISVKGVIIALVSSFSWTIHLLSLDYTQLRHLSPRQILFFHSCFSIVVGGTICVINRETPFQLPLQEIFLLGLSGIICYGLAGMFLTAGIQRVGAGIAAVFGILEPGSSIAFGLLLKEKITPRQGLASILILIAVLALLIRQLKETKTENMNQTDAM